jgi:hypothetical protein
VGVNNKGSSTITNSYATGSVTGNTFVGGLVGGNNGGTITNSYYGDTTGQVDVGKGTLKTDAQMKTEGTFTGWDFDAIWKIDSRGINNSGYPYLQWQVYIPIFFNLPGDNRPINIDEGQTITTNPYIIKALPSSADGISKVEFYIDDTLICATTTADADGVYSCPWDTSKYHSDVKVYAYDDSQMHFRSLVLERSTTLNLPTELPQTGADIK